MRHGRSATCAFSAVCWIAGGAVVVAVRGATLDLAAAYATFAVLALVLLRTLATDRGARRDEASVAAIALVGRGTIVTVIGHLSILDAGWVGARYHLALAAFVIVTVGQATSMARRGPVSRLTAAACEVDVERRSEPPWEGRREISQLDAVPVPGTGAGRRPASQPTGA